MPLILIKNNMKLMFRSKAFLPIMIIMPVIVIALLSTAFKDMMTSAREIDPFTVGYRIIADSPYQAYLPELKEVCARNDVNLVEYPEGDMENLIRNQSVAVFVDIEADNYSLYRSSEQNAEALVAESIFDNFFYNVGANEVLAKAQLEQGSTNVKLIERDKQLVTHEVLEVEPMPSSTDYYGIIYIAFWSFCGMMPLAAVIASERKNAIPQRMRVSQMTKGQFYLAKFIPCFLATFLGMCLAWLLSVVLFDIHWGQIAMSAGIILLSTMAAAAIGVFLYQLFSKIVVSIVVGFLLTWIAGFLGGSFDPYIYEDFPIMLMKASPLYYVNRTLVEFATKGFSDYAGTCLFYLISLIIVFGILGSALMNRKVEE